MPSNNDADLFAELRKIDTPSITNVVATYPTNPVCLGLYNPWSENWYTDTSIRCMYPELGAVAGYAVTCVYSVPDPNYNRLTFMDVIDADASPKPTILVLHQKFPPSSPPSRPRGHIMVTSMLARLFVPGLQLPVTRYRAIRSLRFQYLPAARSLPASGTPRQAVTFPSPSAEIGCPSCDIVHMDEMGVPSPRQIEAVRPTLNALLRTVHPASPPCATGQTAAEVRRPSVSRPIANPKK